MNAKNTFDLLNEQDWSILLQRARRLKFKKDDVLIQEGSQQKALFILRNGYVRVVRTHNGQPLAHARLGPGQVFGEMSFLEHAGASASVIAEDDVELDEIDGAYLNSLIGSEPGFSARFYNSLAVTLSQRLRDVSLTLGELNVNEIAQVNRFHRTRLGHITDRQIPEGLAEGTDEFQARMRELDRQLKTMQVRPDEAQTNVNRLCDEILNLLERYTRPETLVEIGYDDLLSFRDTDNLDTGVGAFVFRETFSLFMLSETIAHCYMKPRGFSDDFKTGELIHANEARGDGRLGALIDRWFLNRSYCAARRALHNDFGKMLLAAAHRDGDVFHIASLASGASREIFDCIRKVGAEKMRVKCLDIDQEALAFASKLAQESNCSDRVDFMQENVLSMAEGRGKFELGPQEFIYALGFADYLADDQVVSVLNWIHANLSPNGSALLTNTDPRLPDRLLLTHILEWEINYRDQDEIATLFERSAFKRRPDFTSAKDAVFHAALCTR